MFIYVRRFKDAYREGRIHAGIVNWFLYPGSSDSGRFDRGNDYDNERGIILSIAYLNNAKMAQKSLLEKIACSLGFEMGRLNPLMPHVNDVEFVKRDGD